MRLATVRFTLHLVARLAPRPPDPLAEWLRARREKPPACPASGEALDQPGAGAVVLRAERQPLEPDETRPSSLAALGLAGRIPDARPHVACLAPPVPARHPLKRRVLRLSGWRIWAAFW